MGTPETFSASERLSPVGLEEEMAGRVRRASTVARTAVSCSVGSLTSEHRAALRAGGRDGETAARIRRSVVVGASAGKARSRLQYLQQVVVVAHRMLAPARDATLARLVGLQQIYRSLSQEGEVVRAVTAANSATVFVEGHAQHPVEALVDPQCPRVRSANTAASGVRLVR